MRVVSPFGSNNYRAGAGYSICDECGLTFRRSEMRKRWDNAMVCQKDWEPQHPQEFVRPRKDRIAVRNPRVETYQPILNDGCLSSTGWTLGSGWTLADDFRHSSGTAVLDRALAGVADATEYLLQVRTYGRNTGSLVVSLLTSTTESGDLTITADGQADITFTAAAITDTIRFTPSTDFDGAIQWVAVYPYNQPTSQGDL